MPLTATSLNATKKAAKAIQRRVRRTCEEVRHDWTNHERRQRRLEAFQMQNRLASVLGLKMEKAAVRVPR